VRSRPEIRYARSGDLHIAYQVSGQGPDLLCIPGFVANSETLWEEPQTARFLERLNASARLTLFDKRGTGHSDAHIGERPPSLDDLAGDARAVAEAAGARRPVVWGISEGVSVAVRMASTWPDRVAGLVLYAGFALGIPSELPEELRIVVERWGSGRTLEVFAPTAARDPAKRRWWARWERFSASPGAALQHMASIGRIDVRADLPRLRMPVLVLHRIGDRAVNVASSRYIAKKIPGAQLLEYEGDDHLPSFGPPGGPERLVDDILQFCRRIEES
jgi:pimeloyl-ACP methyl ester carboxylesterase